MDIEKILEFDKVKDKWREFAVTEAAADKIRDMTFFISEAELRKNIRDTTDARNMIEGFGPPPLAAMDELPEILSQAVSGGALTPFYLERTAAALTAVRRLKDYLKRGKTGGNPLAYYEENLEPLDGLREEIFRQIRGGQVDSHASKELLEIRNGIIRAEEKMKQAAEQVMRSHRDCMADSYCTYRNGRLCVPVKKECRAKISGSVIDKSATGSTLFMEPSSAARYYDELESLRIDEENEVSRILYTLSAMAADNALVIRENIRITEKLDFIFSKGKLSLDLDCTEPKINTERRIILKNARHPLMDIRTCVPLNISMGGEVKGIVITGPNTGGKTVSIKTTALNCLMAQCGLHVACEEADICMNSSFLCDIGDGQNLSENLSTFSAHIRSVLEIMGELDSESLVVMDELGSGTDPTEGMGIAIAILEELRKSGCLFLVTTHYPEVKEYAENTENIVNARMAFDRDSLSPTYRLELGKAGESCAFYIAERLGMPQRMLRTARAAAYGETAGDGEIAGNAGYTGNPAGAARSEIAGNAGGPSKPGPAKSRIKKARGHKSGDELREKYSLGDSVMLYPDRKIGIVCEPVNEKGILRVQLPDKKIWINHKRVKLHVVASELYPEGYDFSIVFDTVENRKIRHDMERKLTDGVIVYDKED